MFRDGALVYVGRIGTGFGATTVHRLMPKLKAHAQARSPFAKKRAPPRDRAVHWLDPVLVAEVEFAGWSGDGLVRQAAFKGLREDKPATDVVADAPRRRCPPASLAEPAATVTAKTAAPAPKPKGKSGKVVVMGVTLSHPDKALWPDAGDGEPVTKRDLALYLEAVGAWMLPHLEGRPCSIIRAPDGIDGQTFFQRHAMAGGSKLFDTVEVLGDHEPYLVINNVEALAAVAQSGGLELHPSNGVPGDPMLPGRLVFDLDPAPDVAFAEVVTAAREMKARLESLGLVAFCKTTGGKGLHVVDAHRRRGQGGGLESRQTLRPGCLLGGGARCAPGASSPRCRRRRARGASISIICATIASPPRSPCCRHGLGRRRRCRCR